MNPKYLLIISLFISFLTSNTFAEKTHGIAMHGNPKYEEGFAHLDYVNPDAPKGGSVRFGAYGA
ncbi:MAG: ABC transporter substrate-binding protein, partial [Pelagibacteraceae bacterium]|nr:ABC transporter substrate-binding protein [Pelagibacteraceae bacterium]